MDQLRSAVSLIGHSQGFRPWLDIKPDELRANALQVCATVPTLIMALHRLGQGQQPIDPDPELGYGENYLWMLTGERPDPDKARAVEQYQILTIDHGFNASTFTSRVITSTGADLAGRRDRRHRRPVRPVARRGAVAGARPARRHRHARQRPALPGRRRHPRRQDHGVRPPGLQDDRSRSVFLREVAEHIEAEKVAFATQVERTVVEVLAELKPGRNLYANVEFYAGVVMEDVGLPRDLFSPTFASSRVIGWCANILEQAADNRIIRPSAATSARRRRSRCPTRH